MSWIVREHPEFSRELNDLDRKVIKKLAAVVDVLELQGPDVGRPQVDTLIGSKHANMKELRFSHEGVWRFAFVFDPERQAVLLVGGNKQGVDQKRLYKNLIRVADRRYDEWLKMRRK